MVQRTISLLLALGFAYVFIQAGQTIADKFLYIAGLIVATGILNFFVHFKNFKRRSDAAFLLPPIFFIFATISVSAVLPGNLYKTATLALCSLLFFIIELRLKPRLSAALFYDNIFLLSAFGVFLGIWSADFFVTPAWWIVVGTLFLISLLLLWYGFYPSPLSNYEKFVFCLVIAFALAQIGWALLLWPLHYFTMALVFTSFFFLGWELTRFHIRGSLTRQKIIFHFSVVCILLAVALYTAQWTP